MEQLIKSKMAVIAIFFWLIALFFAGLQPALASENTLNVGIQTLNEYYGEDFGKDPTQSNTQFPDQGGICVAQQRYTHFAPLITLDTDGNIIPWLADSYSVSDDQKTLTLHLRNGVKFSDGTELNASIVKFNLDRIVTRGWKDRFGKTPLYQNYDSTEVINETTLKVSFTKSWLDMPFAFASHHFLGYFISPLDVEPAWDINGILRHETRYNGLGPYYVDENESTQKEKVVLVKQNSWYDELGFHKPKLDRIIFTVISDPQTRLMALKKGDIDLIYRYYNVPLDSLPSLENDRDITIKSRSDTLMYFLATSWWKEPFNGTDGIKLRKALSYALDRDEIAKGAFYNYAVPATDSMFISPLLHGFSECCRKGYDYDPEKARQLIKDAGWNDTNNDGILDKNGKPLELNIVISSSTYDYQKDLALIVRSQLKKMGVDVKINDMESGAQLDTWKKGDFDMIVYWSNPRYQTMSQTLASRFISENRYYISYENQNGTLADVVKNTESATNERDLEKYAYQASEILYEDAGVIPLVYRVEYAVMSSKVQGYEFGAQDYLDRLEECWIKK